jgi:hypothetical protein
MSGSRIEIPVWGLKLFATGMTGYRENRSKTGLNSNFKFENAEIGYRAVLPVPKSVNRSKFEFQDLEEKMAKIARRTTDDEIEGLVLGEAVDVKSQTQIRL